MVSSAASWAHVTIYYGSFFAASALLRMFGACVGDFGTLVEVSASSPGTQQLSVRRKVPSTHKGSHERFWDLFYSAASSLIPWVDPALRLGIIPVSSNPIWQIQTRNKINYDTYEAFQLMNSFHAGFSKRQFRKTLPGVLNTQFAVFEAKLLITCDFVKQFGLITDALDSLGPIAVRKAKVQSLVLKQSTPRLSRNIKRTRILV
jgi:hypothetical protein